METLTTREAIRTAIMMEMLNLIVKSDSLVVIESIFDQTHMQKQINTLIANILSFASRVRNISCPIVVGQQILQRTEMLGWLIMYNQSYVC